MTYGRRLVWLGCSEELAEHLAARIDVATSLLATERAVRVVVRVRLAHRVEERCRLLIEVQISRREVLAELPAAKDLYRAWGAVAGDTVVLLRAETGRDPHDKKLPDLVGELSIRITEFRTRWAAHDVRIHTSGVKLMHHPVVGDLDLPYESFPLAAAPNLSLVTYSAEPGSPSEDALQVLANWAATNDVVIEQVPTDQDA